MLKNRFSYLIYIFSLVILISISCSKKNDNNDADNADSDTDEIVINSDIKGTFLNAAQLVLPVFNIDSTPLHLTSDFTWGNVNFEMFVALGNPEDDITNEWGNKNLYNNLKALDTAITILSEKCPEKIDKTVETPFNFGSSNSFTYECAENAKKIIKIESQSLDVEYGAAWTKTDSAFKAVIFSEGHQDHLELSGFEGSYDENTGNLTLNQIGYISYLTEDSPNYTGNNKGKFIPRMEAQGNTKTHEFTLRIINYNPGADDIGQDGYNLFIVGKGISRGEGKYFLFKVKDNSQVSTEKYFCFPAQANIEFITNLQGTDYDNISANCSTYKEDVKNMEFFTNNDVPQTKFDSKITW